ncbi:hypothetical protein D3C81_918170 [compost metagenome]
MRTGWPDDRRHAAGADAPGRHRRPVAPGPAFRPVGRSPATTAQQCLQPVVPGDVQRAALGLPAKPHAGRHAGGLPGQRCQRHQVRPVPGGDRPGRPAGLLPDLQPRPVRRAAYRAHGRALATTAGRFARQPATPPVRTANAEQCRATSAYRPIAGRTRFRPWPDPPRSVRRPGRAHATGGRVDLRRPALDLRRARPAGQPPGACPARTGCRPAGAGGPGAGALAGNGRRPAGHPQGRRRLCTTRPRVPARPPALHDRRQPHRLAAQPACAAAHPGRAA